MPENIPSDGVHPVPQFRPPHLRVGILVYLPAAQLVHRDPAVEYLPARQFMQAVEDVDPEGDDLPAGQLVHDTPATPWQTYTTFRNNTPSV